MDDITVILEIAVTFAVTVGLLLWFGVLGYIIYLMFGPTKGDE